jgi:hypothetical protein
MAIELPLWIYWVFCGVAAVLLWANRPFALSLLSPDSSSSRQGYPLALSLGWGATLATAAIYVLFTIKILEGPYRIPDLAIFSVLNGVLEQLMFVLWFLLGCYLGKQWFSKRPLWEFSTGYLSYVLYSGLIHPFFWFAVLPEHQPFLPMVAILPLMSFFWMWLYWRYQDLLSIIAMHIVIDWITVGHLHFPWFEPFQIT